MKTITVNKRTDIVNEKGDHQVDMTLTIPTCPATVGKLDRSLAEVRAGVPADHKIVVEKLAHLTMKEGDYLFHSTPMGKIGTEIAAKLHANRLFSSALTLKKELSVLDLGKNFHKAMQKELGLSVAFCRQNQERMLRINIETGMPELDPQAKHAYREVVLVQPIVSYTMFETADGTSRFICIGCTNKTVYMIVREELAYSFVIDMSSLNAKEAVKNLYVSNLNKGPIVFQKTTKLLDNFFLNLFSATFSENTLLEFEVVHISGNKVNAKLYLHPRKPEANMFSVNGWVYDVLLDEFPGKQINRGYNIRKKNL